MPRTAEDDADDLWRGNRLILSLAAVGISVLAFVALRFGPSEATVGLNASVASFDLAAERPQRFVVSLVTDAQEIVAHGDAELSFSYLGDEGAEPVPGPTATATWQPIAGTKADDQAPPTIGDVPGVYVARDVDFDRPGVWQVVITIDVAGQRLRADAAFEVLAEHALPAVGDAALRTVQPLADGAPDPGTIDSRAGPTGPIPDPDLHDLTLADAIGAGRPTMVVVSTPSHCVSRFCGPITEAVERLEARYGDRMAFVHLEVWQDYDAKLLNPAAAEWIRPSGAEEATEPWTWVIGADGVIVERFDNAVSDRELEAAVRSVLQR